MKKVLSVLTVVMLCCIASVFAVSNQERIESGTMATVEKPTYVIVITSNVASQPKSVAAVAKGVKRRIHNNGPYNAAMKRGDGVAVSTTGIHLGIDETIVDNYFGILYFDSYGMYTYPGVATSSVTYISVETIKLP